jgi:hypothetical protein
MRIARLCKRWADAGQFWLAGSPSARYDRSMIGREVLFEEEASPNYRLREVRHRRTGHVSWEVTDAGTGMTVAGGFVDRQEALRVVRAWERLSQRLEGGLAGHILVH